MKPAGLALWLVLIGLVLVTIAAMKENGATKHPLLVDSAYEQTEPATEVPWALSTRCTIDSQNLRTVREDET